jgi:hypothetical protein
VRRPIFSRTDEALATALSPERERGVFVEEEGARVAQHVAACLWLVGAFDATAAKLAGDFQS